MLRMTLFYIEVESEDFIKTGACPFFSDMASVDIIGNPMVLRYFDVLCL